MKNNGLKKQKDIIEASLVKRILPWIVLSCIPWLIGLALLITESQKYAFLVDFFTTIGISQIPAGWNLIAIGLIVVIVVVAIIHAHIEYDRTGGTLKD